MIYEFLKANRNISIEIQGFTDNKGSDDYNFSLSNSRAQEVYNYLRKRKVPERMLSYKGYGATSFVSSNETEEGRSKNRRIEFKINSLQKKSD